MKEDTEKRGFTTPEKWIVWSVFCLLVGLSTQRFTVFLGLLMVSFGLSQLIRKQSLPLGILSLLLGIVAVAFSKYLF